MLRNQGFGGEGSPIQWSEGWPRAFLLQLSGYPGQEIVVRSPRPARE